MLRSVTLAAVAALSTTAVTRAGEIDRALQDKLDQAAPGDSVSALVYPDQIDLVNLDRDLEARHAPRIERHRWVVTMLQQQATATQGALLEHLKDLADLGRIERFEPFWITNAVCVVAPK